MNIIKSIIVDGDDGEQELLDQVNRGILIIKEYG